MAAVPFGDDMNSPYLHVEFLCMDLLRFILLAWAKLNET